MTDLAGELAHAATLLRGLADRAEWAHGLAYDRPGRRLDHEPRRRSNVDDQAAPVGRWRHGTITAAADPVVADAYIDACVELWHAWWDTVHVAFRVGLGLFNPATPLDTDHAARHLQLHCQRHAGLLDILAIVDLDRTSRRLLCAPDVGVIARITHADELIPDARNPFMPDLCRNPRDRTLCRREIHNWKRRLCESCKNHEDYLARTTRRSGVR